MPDIVYALAANGDTVFAARSSGLVRSFDGGSSWNPVFARIGTDLGIPASAVALSPQFHVDKTVFAAVLGGVLRSSDSGETWKSAELAGPAPFITALAVSLTFESDHTLFAASLEDGVFRSTDGGATWASWNFGLLDFQVLSLAISADNWLYAGTGTGLFVSQNAGRTWHEIFMLEGKSSTSNSLQQMDKNQHQHVPVLSLACSPGLIVVGTEGSGLYACFNNQQAWQQLGQGLLESINALSIDGNTILAVTLDALVLSRDSGNTWQQIHWPSQDENPVVVIAPNGLQPGASVLAGGSDGGLFKVELPWL